MMIAALTRLDARPTDASLVADARPTDASLVAAALAGLEEAKAELFRRHVRMASDMAYRLLGRDGEVEGVVQQGFVIAFTALASLGDPGAFRSWLGAIVTRRAIAVIRRRGLLSRLGFVRVEPLRTEMLIARDAPPNVFAEVTAVYRNLATWTCCRRPTGSCSCSDGLSSCRSTPSPSARGSRWPR